MVQKVKIKATINVRVRSGAGTSFTKIADVYGGQVYVKLGEETGTDGHTWIKIQLEDGREGYIRSDFAEAVTE